MVFVKMVVTWIEEEELDSACIQAQRQQNVYVLKFFDEVAPSKKAKFITDNTAHSSSEICEPNTEHAAGSISDYITNDDHCSEISDDPNTEDTVDNCDFIIGETAHDSYTEDAVGICGNSIITDDNLPSCSGVHNSIAEEDNLDDNDNDLLVQFRRGGKRGSKRGSKQGSKQGSKRGSKRGSK